MKKLNLVIATLLVLSIQAGAQSDNCATATIVPLTAGQACVNGTTAGATTNSILYGACNATSVNEVWYTFVAIGSVNDFTVTPQGMQDAEIIIDIDGCGTPFAVCNTATGTNVLNQSWGVAVGTQVWIGIASTSGIEGGFELCIDSYDPPSGNGNTCASAIPLCDDSQTYTVDMTGLTPSGTVMPCSGGSGNQDVFFQFTCTQTGTLEWEAIPTQISGPGSGIELDWVVFDITSGCGSAIDVACNYNFGGEASDPNGMMPGISCVTCPTSGLGGACGEYCDPITITAGNTYVILIDNYSYGTTGSNASIDFSFGPTMTAEIAPNVDFTVAPPGVTCASSVTVNITDNSTGIPDWDFGNGNTYTGNNPPNQTYSTPGTYAITATISGPCPSTQTEFIQLFGPLVVTPTSNDETCGGACDGDISLTVTGGDGIYSYSWSPAVSSGPTATGLCPGSYDITVVDATCGTPVVTTVVIAPGMDIPTAVVVDETCAGDNDGQITVTEGANGTPAYTYDISGPVSQSNGTGVFTNLPPGNYSVDVTDGVGCIQTINVTINPGPSCCPMTNTEAFTDPTCALGCNGTITLTENLGVPPVQYSIDAGSSFQATGNFTSLCAGVYPILIQDNNGCQYISSITLTDPPTITGSIVTQTNISCNGVCDGSVDVTASGGTGILSYDNGGGPQPTGTFAGLCVGANDVTITDANGCTYLVPVNITEPPILNLALVSTTDATCGASNGALEVSASGGTTPYQFDIGGPQQASGVFSGLAASTYTVTVTDANNCTVTLNVTVLDLSGLGVTVDLVTNVLCNGGLTGAVDVTTSGGTSPYTFAWTGPGGPYATEDLSGIGAGTYDLTVTDFNGCPVSVSATVNEPTALTSLVSGVDALCNGSCDGSIDLTIGGGTTTYSYAWTGPSGFTSALEDPTGLCAGTYDVVVTDANSCTINDTYTINEPTAITLATSNTPANCGQADGSVSVTASGGTVVGAYGYLWEDSTPSVVGTTATVGSLPGGSYTITVTDDNGCTATAVESISNLGGGAATAVMDIAVSCNGNCDGQATVSMAGGTSPYTYLWSSGSTPTAATTGGLCAGTHSVDITDAVGCISSTTVTITEPSAVSVSTITLDEICIGDCQGSIDITGSGGTPPYQYSIDNCVTMLGTNLFTGLCSGNYNVCIEDANGCKEFTTVTINPGAAFADATIDVIGPFCEDAPSAVLTAASPGGTWSGTGVAGSNFNPATAGAGSHWIYYTIGGACGDIDSLQVVVNPLPTMSFTADVTSGCEPLTVTFTNTGATGTCLWDFGDGGTSSNCNPTYTYNSAGTYDVTLTVTDANGCTNTYTATNYINVYSVPNADFTFGPQPADIMDPTISFTDQSSDAVTWQWDFAGLGSSLAQNPTWTFDEIGSYPVTLVVTSTGGCSDTITYTIMIGDVFLIYVPNAVTVDGDGINDVFYPVLNGIDETSYQLFIFNRWGELIFESYSPQIGWDATYKSTVVQEDVYVWKIIVKDDTYGESHEYVGHVTVLK